MNSSFRGKSAGVELKVVNLKRFLAEQSVAGEEICYLLKWGIFQSCKSYVRRKFPPFRIQTNFQECTINFFSQKLQWLTFIQAYPENTWRTSWREMPNPLQL